MSFLHNQPLLAGLLYCSPWHIVPSYHQELGELYQKYLRGELQGRTPATREERALPGCAAVGERVGSGLAWAHDESEGVAVVWLDGIICKRAAESMSGPAITDLAKLDRILKAIAGMPRLESVAMVFDTPGGCSLGLPESAELIQELGRTRRVVAYTDAMCCSAGYWLAAAAQEIGASPSAVVGSIGTYIAALDSSRQWEMEGLELKLFRSGSLKGLGMAGKPWTAAEEEHLQALVDRHGAEFRVWVVSQRGAIAEEAMQGQWFHAKEAPEGLVDGLYRDLEEFLAAVL